MALQLTIKAKLVALCMTGLGLVGILGTEAYVTSSELEATIQEMEQSAAAHADQLSSDMHHDALRGDVLAAFVAGYRADTAAQAGIKADLAEHAKELQDALAEAKEHSNDQVVKAKVDAVSPAVTSYIESAKAIVSLAGSDMKAAEAQLPDFLKRFKAVETEMAALSEAIEANQRTIKDDSAATISAAHIKLVAFTIVAAAVLLIIGVAITRSIVRPIDAAIAIAERISGGDLTGQMVADPGDQTETGRLMISLQTMNANLIRILGEIRFTSDTIATASTQIAAGNQDLSHRTEQQAGSLEETASSMQEITATVRTSAETAQQANLVATDATQIAERGGEVVSQVVQRMGSINQSASEIAGIISVIDGIAFQTNILALNAAVEAARAGEQGRGFAVVASEVRALAQRSSAAAREIKALIDNSVSEVAAGSTLVQEAGATIDEVVASVRRVSALMGELASASREQSAGIEQVNRAIEDMDSTTQQNASLVEEASAAAESLRTQAQRLATTVEAFRMHGSVATAQPAARPALTVPARTAPAAVARVATARRVPLAAPRAEPRARMVGNGTPVMSEWEEF